MGGVGKTIGKIFGGGSSPKAPEVIVPEPSEPAPVYATTAEPVAEEVRNAETKKNRVKRGASGTLLTSPLGTTGTVAISGTKLGGS